MIQLSRRKLLGGLSALIAAPAIIKVAGIMPVKVWEEPQSDFDRMVSEMLRRNSRLIAENITAHNALYARMKQKGFVRYGGYDFHTDPDYLLFRPFNDSFLTFPALLPEV